MNGSQLKRFLGRIFFFTAASAVFILCTASSGFSGEYKALDGVKGVKAVFDFTLGEPDSANVVFGAVKDLNQNKSTRSLSEPPKVVVVFHGPAVHLISTDLEYFDDSEKKEIERFVQFIREMKKNGVTFEVCEYALKMAEVDPATIIPEVEHVGNGFISVVGYQAQGYSVVDVP